MTSYFGIVIYSSFRLTLASFIIFYWTIVLLLPSKIVKNLEPFSLLGRAFNSILKWLFKAKCLQKDKFKDFITILNTSFVYPIRIKAGGTIAFALCFTNTLVVNSI